MRGGGFGGFWGDHMVFRGEDRGIRRILGRSHGFQGEKKGGGESVVTNGV